MENTVEIILNYDFDPEQGYTQTSIDVSKDWLLLGTNLKTKETKLGIYLFEEDIRKLLKGTGITIDAE